MGFITVAGQLVREDAITRLSTDTAAGVSGTQCYVHFADGGVVSVSEIEFRKLRRRLEPPTSRKKSA